MIYSLSRNALLGVLGSTAALSALIGVALVRGGNDPLPSGPVTTHEGSSGAGMVAAKDPVTGALRAPTAEEMAALQPAPTTTKGNKKQVALRSEQLANGAIVTTLDQSYDLYSVATKDTAGQIRRACVPAPKLDAAMEAAQNHNHMLNPKEVLDEK